MRALGTVMALVAGVVVNFPLLANDEFSKSMNYAQALKGTAVDAFTAFKPADNLPDYSSEPDAKKYYAGGQRSGDELTSAGKNTLNSTEWGKVVTDSISRQPHDRVKADSPFLQNGRRAENNAETVFDPKLCEPKAFEKSVFNHYVCSRDMQVQHYCTRKGTLTGEWRTTGENKTITVTPQEFSFSRDGKKIVFSFSSPEAGDVIVANLKINSYQYFMKSKVNFMNTTFFIYQNDHVNLNAAGMMLTKGQVISGDSCSGGGSCKGSVDDAIYTAFVSGRAELTLQITMHVAKRTWEQRIEWSENCPFDKAEGRLISSECIDPGGSRTVYQEGKPFSAYQECWAYKDGYLTQRESEGTCGAYIHNPACNVINQKCVDLADGACLHADITYSCETKMKVEGQVCGDALFCTEGSCVLDNHGKNDMFAKTASELAAVAAAGKDVARMNGRDVKIFTGKRVFCKKFAAGFSNCCKDSGWGQDVGLARCSRAEKALGKAKEKRLTLYVGEFCSKRRLGICIEKKRGYCQFDSKLAQIVQQQGRAWQLGIGFGSGSSPKCRGMTSAELQKIDFSKIDFSAFYDDLNSGSDIPADSHQMARMKDRMEAMFHEGSNH